MYRLHSNRLGTRLELGFSSFRSPPAPHISPTYWDIVPRSWRRTRMFKKNVLCSLKRATDAVRATVLSDRKRDATLCPKYRARNTFVIHAFARFSGAGTTHSPTRLAPCQLHLWFSSNLVAPKTAFLSLKRGDFPVFTWLGPPGARPQTRPAAHPIARRPLASLEQGERRPIVSRAAGLDGICSLSHCRNSPCIPVDSEQLNWRRT